MFRCRMPLCPPSKSARTVHCRDDVLIEDHVVVGREGDSQPVANLGVAVDGCGYPGSVRSSPWPSSIRGGLRAEDEAAGNDVGIGVGLDSLIRGDDAATLRIWRLYSCRRFTMTSYIVSGSKMMPSRSTNACARLILFALFDLGETLTEAWVIGKWLETAQLVKIRKPTIANRFGDELRQPWVRDAHEPPGDAVRDVRELVRLVRGEVLENSVSQGAGCAVRPRHSPCWTQQRPGEPFELRGMAPPG